MSDADTYARLDARLAELQRQLEEHVIELSKFTAELLRLRLACTPVPFLVKPPLESRGFTFP